MPLHIIEGRSGAGKTNYLCQRIVESRQSGRNCLLIVPEQMTYEMELLLMQRLRGGLLGLDVLSLPRLTQRVLHVAGGAERSYLSGEGKRMALRKIIDEKRAQLPFFGNSSTRSGLADALSDMIAQCKRADIPAATLRSHAERLENPLLKAKMLDLATVYEGLDQFMHGRYIDAEDQLTLLIERMGDADFLRDTEIYFDAFFGHQFTEQALCIVARLLECCPDVTVALRTPGMDDEDQGLFCTELQALTALIAKAHDIGLDSSSIERIRLPVRTLAPPRPAPPELRHIERHLYCYSEACFSAPKSVSSEGANFWWMEAPRREDEIHAAALRIDALLRRGVPARNIAIAVGNLAAYAPLLESALAPLPLYLDQKRPLASHGIVSLTLAALQCRNSIPLSALLAMAKSGFASLPEEQIEALEQYALLHGLKYGLEDGESFARGQEADADLYALAEAARSALVAPLLRFSAARKRCRTAQEYCRALFAYYEDIALREALEAFCQDWEQRGEYDIAAENAQVWAAVLALLDQIALLLDGPMSDSHFAQVLEEGFVAHDIGMVPALSDQITVGDVNRLCSRNGIKHLIVLGCNEGSIPGVNARTELIDDEDIELLNEAELPIFHGTRVVSAFDRQCVYALLSRAEQSLFVSWARSDQEGNALFPSQVAERLRNCFPSSGVKAPDVQANLAWNERSGFKILVQNLRHVADDGRPPEDEAPAAAYSYFYTQEHWRDLLAAADRRLFASPAQLDADARPLFNPRRSESASRLETFNRCPFQHFVKYGLQPREKRELLEESSDVGNYYHEALDQFTRQILDAQMSWDNLTEPECDAILSRVLDDLSASHNKGVLQQTARGRTQEANMRQTLSRTVWAMVQQIQGSEFKPAFSEAEIGVDLPGIQLVLPDGETFEMAGKIDRIDCFESDTGRYVRIIDYKSGNHSFSFAELFHGIKLQLPLYMQAALSLGQAGGLFYLHVQDASLDASDLDKLSYEDALLGQYRLAGILLLDDGAAIPAAMDRRLSELGGKSLLIPVTWKKNGEPDSRSSVLTEDELHGVLTFALDKATSSIQAIRDGATNIAPYQLGQRTACDWCNYRSICRFESSRGGAFRPIGKIDKETFFALLPPAPEEQNE